MSGAGEALAKTPRTDWHTIRNFPEGGPPFPVFFLTSIDADMTLIGDIDGDGMLDVSDVNMLNAEISTGSNISSFDLNNDEMVDANDLKNTWFGDANLDGEFNSGDLTGVFKDAKHELDVDASWAEGDWTGNGRFDSKDMIAAFQDNGYEVGPRAPSKSNK